MITVSSYVRVLGRPELGVGEVLRISENGFDYRADIAFEGPEGRRLETLPLSRLEPAPDLWQRLSQGDFDHPLDFALKQLAFLLPLANTGGELSCSRTDLLPHQILLTHDVVALPRRRLLIADEVGLGKTIETGMVIRELVARGEAERVMVVAPAGLILNWQRELEECFGLHFDILGIDFTDTNPQVWETHPRVIASIDRLKQPRRKERLAATRWDLLVFDEAHHLSRTRTGGKVNTTQNYRLAEEKGGRAGWGVGLCLPGGDGGVGIGVAGAGGWGVGGAVCGGGGCCPAARGSPLIWSGDYWRFGTEVFSLKCPVNAASPLAEVDHGQAADLPVVVRTAVVVAPVW